MTIEDPKRFVAGLWDWEILDGCFGDTKIAPTDIDGFIERNGSFLVIETKAPNAPLKDGQRLTFERLAQLGSFMIIVVWGETNKPQAYQCFSENGVSEKLKCDTELFRRAVTKWFNYAEKGQSIRLVRNVIPFKYPKGRKTS